VRKFLFEDLTALEISLMTIGILAGAVILALVIWCSVRFFKQKAGDKAAEKAVRERRAAALEEQTSKPQNSGGISADKNRVDNDPARQKDAD
jgi:uncharacterized membrane protein YqiK